MQDFDYHLIKSVKILVVVALPEDEKAIVARLRELGARGATVHQAHGSATPGLLRSLGLDFDSNEKALIVAVAHDDTATEILQTIGEEFFAQENSGMGFSVDVDGFGGARMLFR